MEPGQARLEYEGPNWIIISPKLKFLILIDLL